MVWSGRFLLRPAFALALFFFRSVGLRQLPGPDLMQVVGEDAQPDVALVASEPFVRTAIQPVMLEAVDVALHGAVLVLEARPFLPALALAVGFGSTAF